jgi:hypothetical protein
MKKTVWAVIAGVVFTIVVTTLVDIPLHIAGVYPLEGQPIDDSLALLAISYRVITGIAGTMITVRLAQERPMKHAMILGGVGTIFGLIGLVATWNKGLGPNWYPIALVVLAIPQCWAGARLYQRLSDKK